MIKNFKIYEMHDNSNKDYIVGIPSGEVIYAKDRTILYLSKLQYIHYDLNLNSFTCKDFYIPQVLDIIRRKENKNDFNYEKKRIELILQDWGIFNQYEILEDLSVNVFESINMSYEELPEIPIKFNRCVGDFNCSHNNLVSLKNAPDVVHGSFVCSYNKLVSLEMGPSLVGRCYDCSHNNLKTLRGCPLATKDFDCSYNSLKDLNYAPIVKNIFIKNNNLFNEL